MAVITWLLGHQSILAAGAVGVMDLVFALLPNVQSNGVLHWVYLSLKSMAGGSSSS